MFPSRELNVILVSLGREGRPRVFFSQVWSWEELFSLSHLTNLPSAALSTTKEHLWGLLALNKHTCLLLGIQQMYITRGGEEGEKEKTAVNKWCHPKISVVLIGAKK